MRGSRLSFQDRSVTARIFRAMGSGATPGWLFPGVAPFIKRVTQRKVVRKMVPDPGGTGDGKHPQFRA